MTLQQSVNHFFTVWWFNMHFGFTSFLNLPFWIWEIFCLSWLRRTEGRSRSDSRLLDGVVFILPRGRHQPTHPLANNSSSWPESPTSKFRAKTTNFQPYCENYNVLHLNLKLVIYGQKELLRRHIQKRDFWYRLKRSWFSKFWGILRKLWKPVLARLVRSGIPGRRTGGRRKQLLLPLKRPNILILICGQQFQPD